MLVHLWTVITSMLERCVFTDGGGRHLGFVRTGDSAIRSTVPENPTVEPNMKWIGRLVAEIWPFEISPRWRRPPKYQNSKYL